MVPIGGKAASRGREPDAVARGGDALRLMIVPLAAAVLFAGGVYWLKQAAPGRPARPAGAVIQVALLAVPTPLPTAEPQTTSTSAERSAEPPAPEPPLASDPAPIAAETSPFATQAPVARSAHVAFAGPPDLLLDSVTAQFRRALSERLARFKRYPPAARRAGAQGVAVVRFIIGRDGAVSGVALTASSGDATLDREAVATVTRAQPLPGIPAELPDRMELTIPINFKLR